MGEALRYAWRGSGPFWLAGWVQLLGAFGAGLGLLDVPLPFQGNALWSKAASQIVGGIAGVGIVFIARLAVWYARRLAQPYLRAKLGVQMWPILLMASGIFLFIALFGTGAIWAIMQPSALSAGASAYAGKTNVADIGKKLEAIDGIRTQLNQQYRPALMALTKAEHACRVAQKDGKAEACASLDEVYRNFASISDATHAMRFDVRQYPDIEHLLDAIPDREQIGQATMQLATAISEGTSMWPILAANFSKRFDDAYTWCGKSDNELLEMRKLLSQ